MSTVTIDIPGKADDWLAGTGMVSQNDDPSVVGAGSDTQRLGRALLNGRRIRRGRWGYTNRVTIAAELTEELLEWLDYGLEANRDEPIASEVAALRETIRRVQKVAGHG